MKAHLLALMLVIGIASGCTKDKDSDNVVNSTAPVTAVEAPSSALVNQPISFNLTVAYPDGCTSFNKFNETLTNRIKTVTIETTRPAELDCTTAIVYENKVYTFTPTEKGSYTFKFKNYDSWIEKVVTVE